MGNKISKLLNLLKEINFKDSSKNLKSCDVICFCHDVDRSISFRGSAYSPLIDSVREDLEKRGLVCLSISHAWSVLTDEKGFGFPIAINRTLISRKIAKYIIKFLHLNTFFNVKNVYDFIFEKTKAKLIITIGSPDELSLSARLNNVFHVELLHGMGYSTIPWGWDTKETKFLPQGILALDKVSYNTFSILDSKGIATKLIPHPFLKRFFNQNNEQIPNEWIPKEKHNSQWKKEILVSLQWAYAGDHGPYIEYENILQNGLFYEEIEQIVKVEKDILFRFRFHPVQLKNKKYKFLIQFMDDFVAKYPNTEWKESSFLPYPSIIKNCDGNISMSSMSCYDAAAFGVNSFMLCPTILLGGIYEDWYLDLEKEGYLIKSKVSYEFIHSWLLKTKKQEPRLSVLNDQETWNVALDWMLKKSILI